NLGNQIMVSRDLVCDGRAPQPKPRSTVVADFTETQSLTEETESIHTTDHFNADLVVWYKILCGIPEEKDWFHTSTSIPEGEKSVLRQKLIGHIHEPVLQVATQLAIIISKIARCDYPKEWPELLPSLLHLVRTEDDSVQQRALLYLHHVTKSLASKRLADSCLIG
ncbi:hypothetical protein DAPPUDRAFT_275128, partial [Daphnia pulex]